MGLTSLTCDQCGVSLAKPAGKGVRVWIALAGILVIAVASYYFSLAGKPAEHSDQSGESETLAQTKDPITQQEAPAPANPGAEIWRHYHLGVYTNTGPITLLAVMAQEDDWPKERCHLLLPLEQFPARGPLKINNQEMACTVVHMDWENGLVLFSVAGNVLTQQGVEPAVLNSPDATLSRQPLSLAMVRTLGSWLGQHRGISLDEAQQQFRSRQPQYILEDATALCWSNKEEGPKVGDVKKAIAMLDSGLHQVRDHETNQEFTQLLRKCHQLLVRQLAKSNLAEALQQGQQSRQLYPYYTPLLEDLVYLNLQNSDPDQALDLFHEFRRKSPAAARKMSNDVANFCHKLAMGMLNNQQFAEATALLWKTMQLFPNRANLNIAMAKASLGSNKPKVAVVYARRAAQLDPAFSKQLRTYQEAVDRANKPSMVRIPFDPKTHIINAKASMAGHDLQLVVDTGASLTTMPLSMAKRLGYSKPTNRRVQISTAGGMVEAELALLPWISIGSIRVNKVKVVLMDLPGSLAGKGLLGLNVLRRLNMQIDNENSQLLLQKK